MSETINFIAARLGEKTTWAAIFGLLSAAGIATGVAGNDVFLTNLSAVGTIIAAAIGVATKEKKTDA